MNINGFSLEMSPIQGLISAGGDTPFAKQRNQQKGRSHFASASGAGARPLQSRCGSSGAPQARSSPRVPGAVVSSEPLSDRKSRSRAQVRFQEGGGVHPVARRIREQSSFCRVRRGTAWQSGLESALESAFSA